MAEYKKSHHTMVLPAENVVETLLSLRRRKIHSSIYPQLQISHSFIPKYSSTDEEWAEYDENLAAVSDDETEIPKVVFVDRRTTKRSRYVEPEGLASSDRKKSKPTCLPCLPMLPAGRPMPPKPSLYVASLEQTVVLSSQPGCSIAS